MKLSNLFPNRFWCSLICWHSSLWFQSMKGSPAKMNPLINHFLQMLTYKTTSILLLVMSSVVLLKQRRCPLCTLANELGRCGTFLTLLKLTQKKLPLMEKKMFVFLCFVDGVNIFWHPSELLQGAFFKIWQQFCWPEGCSSFL